MPGNVVNSDDDWILSVLVAGSATGVYLCTLAFGLRWLLFEDQGWRVRKNINWTLLAASLSLFILSSTHIIMATMSTMTEVQRDIRGDPPSSKLPWTSVVMVILRCSFLEYKPKYLSLDQCTVVDVSILIADAFLVRTSFAFFALN